IYENNNRGWLFPVGQNPSGEGAICCFGTEVPPHERWPMRVFKIASAPVPPPYDSSAYNVRPYQPDIYDPKPYTPDSLLCPADTHLPNAAKSGIDPWDLKTPPPPQS